MTPTARRVFLASQYQAEPVLQEPILSVEINCVKESLNPIYEVFNQKRGTIEDVIYEENSTNVLVKCFLPVKESFGFSEQLRLKTQGRAFPNLVFDHWEDMNGDPFD